MVLGNRRIQYRLWFVYMACLEENACSHREQLPFLPRNGPARGENEAWEEGLSARDV